MTMAAMKAAPINNPGTTKRPGLPGVQYVGIPQFQDVGNRCTQLFSSVIAGSLKDTDALSHDYVYYDPIYTLPETGQSWWPGWSVLNVFRQLGQRASTAPSSMSAHGPA